MTHPNFISAVVEVGTLLRQQGYQFSTVTPETHRRVLGRPFDISSLQGVQALRHFFGWNRALETSQVPAAILRALEKADLLLAEGRFVKSATRFSTLGSQIFAHSGFPTDEASAVFFGPDSYRFVKFVRDLKFPAKKILDIGCGSGVGALSLSNQENIKVLSDINEQALSFARGNAQLNGCAQVEFFKSDLLKSAPADADLLIANPPFIMDDKKRKYRDGGQSFGAEIALNIVRESLEYLKPGGMLALYTGSCIVDGRDTFHDLMTRMIPAKGYRMTYVELDPDIFGEEMSRDPYKEVERISAVGMTLFRVDLEK